MLPNWKHSQSFSHFYLVFPRRVRWIQISLFSLRLLIIFLDTPFDEVIRDITIIFMLRIFDVMSNILSWLSRNSLIEKVFVTSKCVYVLIRTKLITWASVPRVSHVSLYLGSTNVATDASMRILPNLWFVTHAPL